MANQLLESYKKRINLVEQLYSQKNPGSRLSTDKKFVIAQCLENTRKFINESVKGSVGVQLADMGAIKQFCMDVTNLVYPNMIADQLVLVKPMQGFNTVIFYREYALGTVKGGAGGLNEASPFFSAMQNYPAGPAADGRIPGYATNNDPWARNIINGWGTADFMKMSPERQSYTGSAVFTTVQKVDPATAIYEKYTPANQGVINDKNQRATYGTGAVIGGQPSAAADAVLPTKMFASFGPVVMHRFDQEAAAAGKAANANGYAVKVVKADGTVDFFTLKDNLQDVVSGTQVVERHREIDGYTPAENDQVLYCYDNAYIPAEALPTVVTRMKQRPVQAKIRRIAVQYSKLAAWQAKNEFGYDLHAELVQQATNELEYETDCEVIDLLTAMGDANFAQGGVYGPMYWIDEELDTIGYSVKAEGFARKIGQMKAKIYEQTARFMPSWALVSPEMLPILAFLPNYKATNTTSVNGAFQCGSYDGMKIFCTPRLTGKVMYLGVLGKEMDTAAAIYMPFLPITPSTLLDFPDDTTTQGFVTVYGLEALNTQLVGKIEVVEGNGSARINIFEGSEFGGNTNPRP